MSNLRITFLFFLSVLFINVCDSDTPITPIINGVGFNEEALNDILAAINPAEVMGTLEEGEGPGDGPGDGP